MPSIQIFKFNDGDYIIPLIKTLVSKKKEEKGIKNYMRSGFIFIASNYSQDQ
jgi:hypothetical protein